MSSSLQYEYFVYTTLFQAYLKALNLLNNFMLPQQTRENMMRETHIVKDTDFYISNQRTSKNITIFFEKHELRRYHQKKS